MIDINDSANAVTIALCGDVMIGRGIDQILPYPSNPRLHEDHVKSAADYVALAEGANGPIPRKVDWDYIWGGALEVLRDAKVDAFVVNLETAITLSEDYDPKGINYRMHPGNAPCLTAAGIDCCVLANNHILDWGHAGLAETLRTLSTIGVKTAGAGLTEADAGAPPILEIGSEARILIFAFGAPSSGIPAAWAAAPRKPGVNLLDELSMDSAASIGNQIRAQKRNGDIAIASIHWGANWGYEISRSQRRFARALVEDADVDIVHGHSSHHPKAMEIHCDRPIFYGCGDFLNDYEGIAGYEAYRDDLVLLYLLRIDRANGRLLAAELAPFHIRKFRLHRLSDQDLTWLHLRLRREYQRFDLDLSRTGARNLVVKFRACRI